MKKATRKILSLALVVFMLLSTFAMMFANAEAAAETPVTTPKDYATAADGEKLLDVDFNKHWTVIDDTKMSYDNNGVTYSDAGLEVTPDPANNKDVDGNGKFEAYGVDVVAFLNGWNKVNTDPTGAGIIEDEGASLTVRGAIDAIGTEGEAGYVPAVPSDATGNDQRLIGTLPYDLENSTYTMKFDANWNNTRFKFYFANGTFMNFGGMDHFMPCLGLELKTSGYRLMRQSSAVTTGVVGKPTVTTVDKVNSTSFKVVLEGGAKIEDVTLYDGCWLNEKANVGKWIGDVIPVTFTIYNSSVKEDGTVQDIRICTGLIYQPADVNLVFGIGEYTAPSKNQFYSLTNLDIYKGDTSVPFNFNFTKVYEEAGWGSDLTIFDAKGITNDAYNYANGYEWYSTNAATYYVLCEETDEGALESYYETTKDGVTTWEKAWVKKVTSTPIAADAEGVVTIDIQPDALNRAASKVDKTKYILSNYGVTQQAATPIPFGDEWNQGYYEMEFTVNNAGRLKIGLLQTTELDRVGFDILPNGSYESLTNQTGDTTAYLSASNSATLWTSGANSFGTGIVEKSTATLNGYIETIVYDTYVADDKTPNPEYNPEVEGSQQYIVDEDTLPDDPRNVRDYGGNRANIKIVFNCVDYVITLFEKVNGEWIATSAIDYSKAVEAGMIMGACLDFQAYDRGTNATIKNIRAMKGSSVVHQNEWTIGDYTSETYFGYNADFQAEITESFVDYYGLDAETFGWTNDGKTVVEDFKTLYDGLSTTNYGPQTIKLAPIVKYEAAATEATIRGIRIDNDAENGTYDVDFVVALADIEGLAAVGFDIVKTVSYNQYAKTTTVNVETTEVYTAINANGLKLDAAAALGAGQFVEGEGEKAVTYGYAAAFGLDDEAAIENAIVTYEVTLYTIAIDGTKTVSDTVATYVVYNGQY